MFDTVCADMFTMVKVRGFGILTGVSVMVLTACGSSASSGVRPTSPAIGVVNGAQVTHVIHDRAMAKRNSYSHVTPAQRSNKQARKRHVKRIFLTFDDGPNATYTRKVLSALKKSNAKATFFVVGNQIRGNESLVKQVVADGHRVANHSWSHPDFRRLDAQSMSRQLVWTQRALRKMKVPVGTCFRPPYGGMNAKVAATIKSEGYHSILWTVDPQDWRVPPTSTIEKELLAAKNGDVVLLHDGGGNRMHTVAALEKTLPVLKRKGFRFELLRQCAPA